MMFEKIYSNKYKGYQFSEKDKLTFYMSKEKYWLINGIPIFMSSGIIAIKSIFDSFLLESISAHFLQAFALVFPIIILSNSISVSVANTIIGTEASWTNKQRAIGSVVVLSLLGTILLGGFGIADTKSYSNIHR